MSTEPQIPQVADLRRTLMALKDEIFYSLNCIQVGRLVAFDPLTQQATIQLLIKRVVQGVPVDYPLLVNCPAFVYSGGAFTVTVPYQPGDPCMVLFCDRDIDNWFVSGQGAEPNSPRAHDLSDGFALLGFRPLTQPVLNFPMTQAVTRNATAKVGVDITDTVVLENSTGSLRSALTALCTALTSWTDTRGDTPNPATVTAINAVKTQIQGILK